ncbi:MAG TPA: anchored repeat-type ABC transporter ATP-binding subunit [Solirubrobacteraceae bacterium]|nr:anchored repeat-type ABC transporter ATP-binding subunit [Solirubrobacteraceae bacterium]
MSEVALEIEGLSVVLGGRRALDDVSLRVRGGELVGLIGPNGAGKTTLLRAALGLLPPAAGRIAVAGALGYVPQRHDFAWDFPVSVAEAVLAARVRQIGWLRGPRAADRAAVDAALERVAMSTLRDRPVGELSGGQRQRVLVARALARETAALLLDEPFTGLDAPTQEHLAELIAALRDEGRAILMTTHDVAAAAATCDRLCLLNRTVVADGPPDELRDPAVWLRAFGVEPGAAIAGIAGAPS